MDLESYIKKNEGKKLKPYTCSAGKISIGYGHNLTDNGLPDFLIEAIFAFDLAIAKQNLHSLFPHQEFTADRYRALIDIMYQLGMTKFRTFKKMIKAIQEDNWVEVSNQIMDSKYAKQTPIRAKKNATLVLIDEL